MKVSTAMFATTTLVSVLVAGAVWHELAMERQRNSALSNQLVEAIKQIDSLKQRRELPPIPFVSIATSDVVPAVQPASAPAIPGQDTHTNSALRQAALAQLRLQMPQGYPDLMSELELTQEELGRLFDLLVKQQEERGRTSENLSSAGEAERIRTYAEMGERQKAELSAMLGTKYPRYEEYKKTQAARQQVATLRTAMESSGFPMRQDQVRLLTQTMISERQRLQQQEQEVARSAGAQRSQPPEQFAKSLFDAKAESDRRVLLAADVYLTVPQLLALRQQLESRTAISRANFQGSPPSADGQETPAPIANSSVRPF